MKDRFRSDYSWTAGLNGKGRVVDEVHYTGDDYVMPFDAQAKKRTNLINLGFAAALALVQVAAGMVNQDSSRTAWIVFPYLFTFLPVGYFFVGAVSYVSDPLRMQKAQYETGLARMRRSALGSMVMTGISALLDIVYMIWHRGEIALGREFCYLLCLLAYLTVAFCFARYYNKTYSAMTTEPSQYQAQ